MSKIKTSLLLLCLHLNLLADSDISGAWQSTGENLMCICGHQTQLSITKTDKGDHFIIQPYVIDHSVIQKSVKVTLKDNLIECPDIELKAYIKLSKEGDKLAFRDIHKNHAWFIFRKIDETKLNTIIEDRSLKKDDEKLTYPFRLFTSTGESTEN